jgi:hypothetical protein
VRFLIRCYKCNWEGPEEQLVETPGNLIFYDYVAINMGFPDVVRSNHHCPSCGVVLRSHRLSGGMVFDQ